MNTIYFLKVKLNSDGLSLNLAGPSATTPPNFKGPFNSSLLEEILSYIIITRILFHNLPLFEDSALEGFSKVRVRVKGEKILT